MTRSLPIILSLLLGLTLLNEVQASTFETLEQRLVITKSSVKKLQLLEQSSAQVKHFSAIEQAHYFYLVGKVQLSLGLVEKSIHSQTEALELLTAHTTVPSILLAAIYNERSSSIYNHDPGNKDYCVDTARSLAVERQLSNNEARLAEVLASNAQCLYSSNKGLALAIPLLEEATTIAQNSLLTLDQQATIYNRAALLYSKASIANKAYKYNLLALHKWQEEGNHLGIQYMLSSVVVNASNMGEFELAQQHLDSLYQFATEHTDYKDALFSAHYQSGKLAYIQGDWLRSIKFFELAVTEQANMNRPAYIQANYELLAIAYFRANKFTESKRVLLELKEKFPGNPAIKKEIIAIATLEDNKKQQALNSAFALLDKERNNKRHFIKSSTAYIAQENDHKLEQLENFQLKQRFIYSVLIAFFIAISLGTYAYFQQQRKQLANKEKQLTDDLLSRKNQLLADVSHELSTPLTVLKLQVESLKDDLEDDVQVSYDALDSKLDDIQHLIDDIHQLAQSDVGALQLNFDSFELNETLEKWQSELTQFVSQNKLSFEINKELPKQLIVHWDRDRIKQIFANLLNNSIKYTDKPGKIRLSATLQEDIINISIEDSSPSVADEDLSNIFERLYRVENSRSRTTGGSGLGLAICKSLITEHRGSIYAQHSSLGGLKIVIKLPVN